MVNNDVVYLNRVMIFSLKVKLQMFWWWSIAQSVNRGLWFIYERGVVKFYFLEFMVELEPHCMSLKHVIS